MKNKFLKILIIISVLYINIWEIALASITLDGRFSDWNNEPGVYDTVSDAPEDYDFLEIKWTFDQSNLYVYSNINGYLKSFSYDIYISGEKGSFKLNIHCQSTSRFVTLSLYNSNDQYIWGTKGKWMSVDNQTRKVELYVPLSYLVFHTESFTINFNVRNQYDRVLDNGDIIVMGISTGFNFILGILLIVLTALIIYRYRSKKA